MSSPRRDKPVVWPGGPSLQGPHRVGAFAMCPQLEAWSQELHLRPILEKPATFIGTLVHAGLAYRYAAQLAQRPEWFVYKDGYEAINMLGATQPDMRDCALNMFAAYEEKYRNDSWRAVLVEHQFVVHFPNGEPYSARTDLLVWDDGEYVLVDHKSVGKLSGTIRGKYSTDRQMMTGLALSRACGYDVRHIVINALTREMPFPNFKRYYIDVNPAAYASLGRDTLYTLDRMAEVRRQFPNPADRPRNWDACLTKWGFCDYFGLCTGTGGMHDFHVPEEYKDGRQKKGT